MKRVLLTGATGFIGRHVLRVLSGSEYEIHAVSTKTPDGIQSDVTWHRADLLDPGQVSKLIGDVGPTHLAHFAWYAAPGSYQSSLENFRWVQASLALLQAFALNGGQRAVLAGTCAEYDWKYGYCSELLTPLSHNTVYSTCKNSLRLMLDAFAAQVGLSVAWGRIFFLYGPYEHPDRLVSSAIRSALRGEPIRCSAPSHIRDFLYVQDVAEAFVGLLDSDVSGPVNVASGQPVRIRDIVLKIARKLGRQDDVEQNSTSMNKADSPFVVGDITRLRDAVGWRPRFDLDQGLESSISWWEKQPETHLHTGRGMRSPTAPRST